tara:strand:- start:11813 stop:12079 length:267 start_codon:yes stop_codon:yes gene_type:complete
LKKLNKNSMKVEVLTLEKTLFSAEAKSIIVPGLNGQFEMLKNHAPLVSVLQKGIIQITDIKNQKNQIEINSGSIEISNNEIIILADIH